MWKTKIYSDLEFQKELEAGVSVPVGGTLLLYIFNPGFFLFKNQIEIGFKPLDGELVAGRDLHFT
jgi:hypothetical protein